MESEAAIRRHIANERWQRIHEIQSKIVRSFNSKGILVYELSIGVYWRSINKRRWVECIWLRSDSIDMQIKRLSKRKRSR